MVDSNSFVEIKSDKGEKYDGVIVGYGNICGRKVFVYAQDFAFKGGSLGIIHGDKICKIIKLAIKMKKPIIGIIDSGGARIQEGIEALSKYGEIFYQNTRALGVIPQISIIVGTCAGGCLFSWNYRFYFHGR